MRTVVDLGCIPRNGATSLPVLAWEYDPDIVYGFDPGDALEEGVSERRGMKIFLERAAAWIYDGKILFHEDGSGSRLGEYGVEVPCFDFSLWLRRLKKKSGEVFVKMDIEGAEVAILEKMIKDGTDKLMDELLVEWHGREVSGLRCPVRLWWM